MNERLADGSPAGVFGVAGRVGQVAMLFTATTQHRPSTVSVRSSGTGVRRTIALRDRLAGFLSGLSEQSVARVVPTAMVAWSIWLALALARLIC